jgi:hypothetical protein
MNYNKFQITGFDLNKMAPDPAIVIIAKRGSGKSWVARDIMFHYRHIPGGTVISPTDRLDPFYKYFFPDIYIHYDINQNILSRILLRQKMILEKAKRKKKEGKKINPSGILVMDDCLSKKKSWAKDENIMEILMNGRHYKLTYILTMQTPLGITPDLRLNFDYIFLLKEDTFTNKKKLYDNYANVFPTQAHFEKVFSVCTKDCGVMVVDNKKPADDIRDKIFWFKAEKRKFSFGSKSFIELHKKYYDPDYARKRDEELLNNTGLFGFNRNKKGMDIRVEKI